MERNNSIDFLRIICCLSVIAIHVIAGPVSNYSGNLDIGLVAVLEKVHVLMNWSVPVFFMITGYCILSKQEYTFRHCIKHVRKYVVILATVGFMFALLEELYKADNLSFSIILNSTRNVISGNLWDHMWYLYAIIGVYLVLPVIHSFMSLQKGNRLFLTGLLFFFTIVAPSIEHKVVIGINIPFGGYLFYVCFGGLVAQKDLSKKANICIVLAGVISAIYVLLSKGEDAFGYRSLAVCLMACGIFVCFAAIKMKFSKLVAVVSQCTLGVYLIHPLFINVVVKVFKLDLLSYYAHIKLTVFYVVVCLISFIVIYVFRRMLRSYQTFVFRTVD